MIIVIFENSYSAR